MFIRLIQQKVPLGCEVSIYRKNGEEFRGTLASLAESYIVLRDAKGQEHYLSEEMIGGFQPHQSSQETQNIASPPSIPLPQTSIFEPVALPVSSNLPSAEPSPAPLPAPAPSVAYPEAVREQALEIAATFRAAINQTKLEALPIALESPEEIRNLPVSQKRRQMLGEWDTIQNAYKYYRDKDKSLSRLGPIIANCQQYIRKYPEISLAQYNLGCLYLEARQLKPAFDTFKEAALLTQLPHAFYNWAVVALQRNDAAQACYALGEFFNHAYPSQQLDSWYVFLRVAQECQTLEGLPELYTVALEEKREEDARLFLKSSVYILKSYDLVEDAYRLVSELLQPDLMLTSEQLAALLDKLQLTPIETYKAQQQDIQKIRQSLEGSRRKEDIEGRIRMLLTKADNLAREKQFNLAIAEVRKALKDAPEHSQATQKLAEYQAADRKQALSRDDGPYARAKYAKEHENDFKKAEKLFREAIRKGDRLESAVKDLAALLRETDRTSEGIQLLLNYRDQVDNKLSLNNLLSDMYISAGRCEEAISCLEDILKSTNRNGRPVVLKRIALCQARLKWYDSAESTLREVLDQNPKDELAQRWLEGLYEAKQTNDYDELDAFFLAQDEVPDAGSMLSEFLNFHLEQCEYAGVEASKVASKAFTERDADQLKFLADRLGVKRPRERASYYLSAAKILIERGQRAEESRPSVYLRNFCAAMGDACIAEQKPKDVIRSYYAEAFSVAPAWVDQLEVKLSQFVMLYCYPSEELLKFDLPSLEDCLERALNIQGVANQVIEGLWQLTLFHREVGRFLIRKVHPNRALRERMQSLCYELLGELGQLTDDQMAFLQLWEKGRPRMRRLNQEITDEMNYLHSAAHSLDTLQDQIARVKRLLEEKRWIALDRQRLQKIREVLDSMYDYSQQQEYGEREYRAKIIENRIHQTVDEIESSPTRYSLELFRSYLISLGNTVKEHFTEIQRVYEPDSLKVELAIESYPNDEPSIECQVTIFNERGKSPASAIKLQVQESPDGDYSPEQRDITVAEALAGGQSVTSPIPVKVTTQARESETFTLYYQLSYTTRMGQQRNHAGTLPIRLYPAAAFQEIKNPYAAYAEGKVVEDGEMFYGRDQLLDTIVSVLSSSTTKNFVIYGQKRTGKSSLLYHLKRRLQFPIIPVSFSIGEIIDNFSTTALLYRIIQRIEDEFEALADAGYPAIPVRRPSLEELENNPLRFQDYMTDLRRALKREEHYQKTRLMLLLDEFSYIYTQIKRGRVPDTFMKFWKALLEQGNFGSVIVGQDVMPKFIEEFSNEFQVAGEKRVSYLDPDDAQNLIIDPIRIPDTGESRYRGNAVNRLIELTAGNPYYIQIFCDRLVKYMNRKKAIYVTDADIDQVKKDLLSGNNALRLPQFDNLISASESDVDEIAKEDSEAVLRAIANGSRTQDDCDRSAINVSTSASVDTILNDLCKREVIDKKQETLFQIRVKLFKEWLLAN